MSAEDRGGGMGGGSLARWELVMRYLWNAPPLDVASVLTKDRALLPGVVGLRMLELSSTELLNSTKVEARGLTQVSLGGESVHNRPFFEQGPHTGRTSSH